MADGQPRCDRFLALFLALGIWSCGEATAPDAPVHPALVPTGLSITPVVALAGEAFTIELRVPGTAVPVLKLRPDRRLGLIRDGVLLDSLLLYDDGTHGDRAASDSHYTLNGLILPVGESGLAASTLTFATELTVPGTRDTERIIQMKATFRSIDPSVISLPAVVDLAADAQATSRVLVLVRSNPLDVSYDALQAITTRYFELLPDDRDFLVVEAPPTTGLDWSGRAWMVRIPAAGLGVPATGRATFGSQSRLRLVVQASRGIYSPFGHIEGSYCLLIHEFNHQWAAYTGSPLADASRHWLFNRLNRPTSAFGLNGECVMNDLELYLAGLLPADSVVSPLDDGGYSLGDIVTRFGPRIPAWPTAQRDFTIGFVVVANAPLGDHEIAFFHYVAEQFTEDESPLGWTWATATGYRSRLDGLLSLR